MNRFYRRGAAALLVAVPLACDQGPMDLDRAGDQSSIINADGSATASAEEVDLCKIGPSGTTFDFTVAGPAHPQLVTNPSVASGSCVRVAFKGGATYDVTITELAATGFVLDSIVVEQLIGGVTTFSKYTGTNSATVQAGGSPQFAGAVARFYNSAEPNGGLEGCTPGYWKQSQHFDSWPAPYTPGTMFSAVFADAFPGMSLVQVVGLGGGGLNALGRHAVAALLSAGSVDYPMTTGEVIAAFNAAYASGSYEAQKNIFAANNELGCPLN